MQLFLLFNYLDSHAIAVMNQTLSQRKLIRKLRKTENKVAVSTRASAVLNDSFHLSRENFVGFLSAPLSS